MRLLRAVTYAYQGKLFLRLVQQAVAVEPVP